MGEESDRPDSWRQARDAARAQVRAALGGHPGPVAERRPPGPSPRARRRLLLGGAVAVIALAVSAALLAPAIEDSRERGEAERRADERAAIASARARVAREQRPRSGPVASGSAIAALERLVLRDARARVEAGTLAIPVREARCSEYRVFRRRAEPGVRGYTCLAVTSRIPRSGTNVAGRVGYPFWATIDTRASRATWCKVNLRPGERLIGRAVSVRLDRRCDLGR